MPQAEISASPRVNHEAAETHPLLSGDRALKELGTAVCCLVSAGQGWQSVGCESRIWDEPRCCCLGNKVLVGLPGCCRHQESGGKEC